MSELRIETLGDLVRARYRLWAWCGADGCKRSDQQLDLAALVERHGANCRIDAFKARLRCSGCGAPGRIQIVHDGGARG